VRTGPHNRDNTVRRRRNRSDRPCACMVRCAGGRAALGHWRALRIRSNGVFIAIARELMEAWSSSAARTWTSWKIVSCPPPSG